MTVLAIVWSDDQARQLPRDLDPLIVDTQEVALREIVEEELMLALPPFSYHKAEECGEILAEYRGPTAAEEVPAAEKPNPFDVLAQLKRGKILEE